MIELREGITPSIGKPLEETKTIKANDKNNLRHRQIGLRTLFSVTSSR